MKHIRISLIVALVLGAMVAVSSVRAQNAPVTDAPAKKQRMTPEQQLDQTAEKLGLDAGQKAKLKTAMEDRTKAMSELRKDTALSQEDRRAKSKVINDKYTTTVKAFLTDEQKTKFDALQQQPGGKRGKKKA